MPLFSANSNHKQDEKCQTSLSTKSLLLIMEIIISNIFIIGGSALILLFALNNFISRQIKNAIIDMADNLLTTDNINNVSLFICKVVHQDWPVVPEEFCNKKLPPLLANISTLALADLNDQLAPSSLEPLTRKLTYYFIIFLALGSVLTSIIFLCLTTTNSCCRNRVCFRKNTAIGVIQDDESSSLAETTTTQYSPYIPI